MKGELWAGDCLLISNAIVLLSPYPAYNSAEIRADHSLPAG